MLNYLILDYNRPEESVLCLKSIKKFNKVNGAKIIYLSNGGEQDYTWNFYKSGLIDKLILRKANSGCGLGTRELFNDFDLNIEWVIYCQCDQFMIRDFYQTEFDNYIGLVKSGLYASVDLAGNQGHGNYSERAQLINKHFYNKIPNGIAGPGPYTNKGKWTEQYIQEYYKSNNLQFYVAPLLFADNGKNSIREYPCGGILMQETDSKAVYILKPIKERVDFSNVKLNNNEWDLILKNRWKNGTIPDGHKSDSFCCWSHPKSLYDFPNLN